jgi:hypothetical protein
MKRTEPRFVVCVKNKIDAASLELRKLYHGVRMGLDESAVATARTWRYQPARKDGKPVEVQREVWVAFRLHGEGADKIAKLWDRSDTNDPRAE